MTGAVSGSEEYLLQCFNHIFDQRFGIYMDIMEPWLVGNVQFFLCTIHASILSVISQHFLLSFFPLTSLCHPQRQKNHWGQIDEKMAPRTTPLSECSIPQSLVFAVERCAGVFFLTLLTPSWHGCITWLPDLSVWRESWTVMVGRWSWSKSTRNHQKTGRTTGESDGVKILKMGKPFRRYSYVAKTFVGFFSD